MLIRALTRACGRLTFAPDDVVDVSEDDALALIEAGAAVEVLASVKADEPNDEAPKRSRKKE